MASLLLASLTSHAGEPVRQTLRASALQPPIQSLFSAAGWKERLFWLHDFTFVAIAPLRPSAHEDKLGEASAVSAQLSSKDLFKPISQGFHGARLRNPSKEDGVEVSSNLLLQYELMHYQRRDEGGDVGVKLGVHYAFR